jgi:hypothetical protein
MHPPRPAAVGAAKWGPMRGAVGPLPRTIVTGLWEISAGAYQPRGPYLKQILMPYGKVPAPERTADTRYIRGVKYTVPGI